MTLDQVVLNHDKQNLETLFNETDLIKELPLYSILAKQTSIPWLIFVPKFSNDNTKKVLALYEHALKIANSMQKQHNYHYNFAKIGNKNKWLHYHLVFRTDNDEAWPDPVWCREPLIKQSTCPKIVRQVLNNMI